MRDHAEQARPFLINPGPVDDAGKHSHRVGAPNHHHISGSGENTMVATTTTPDTRPARELVETIYARICRDSTEQRFLRDGERGQVAYSPFGLALFVAEIVTEHITPLRAELDAANDAVTDLIGQLDECRAVLGGGAAA